MNFRMMLMIIIFSVSSTCWAMPFTPMTFWGDLSKWTKQMGGVVGPRSAYGKSVATDTSGNIFVAGQTDADLEDGALTGTSDFFLTKYNSFGTRQWTRQLGVATKDTFGYSVATDTAGNVLVAGQTYGGLDGNTLTGAYDFFVTKYNKDGTKQWTRQLGVSPASVYASSVATDTSGNIFVAGNTSGGLDGNTLSGTWDFFVTKYDSVGTKQWTKQLGVATKITFSGGVATDTSGNIFVAGYTYGGLDGNTLTGTSDFFVTKYNSAGTKQWTRQLGVATKDTNGYAVAIDPSGNIFVAGSTFGGLDGNTLTGTQDFFVTKYDSSGTKQWTRQLGAATKAAYANGVATDTSGNIFVAGGVSGNLDGNALTGTQDFFVIKYDSTGTKQWTKQMGVATANTIGRSVATDTAGRVFVAGYTFGGLDGNTLTGSLDSFVTGFDSAGTKQWTRQMGGGRATDAFGQSVTTDTSGNIFVTGYTNGGLDGNAQIGATDFFVTKYDSAGTKRWTRQMGVATKVTYGISVGTDTTGNIFVGGITAGGLDGNALTGTTDFFVTKYDSAGTKQWTRQMGVTTKETDGMSVTTDTSGNIFVAGYTFGGLDGNTLTGITDFFVTKYNSAGTKQWTRQMGVATKGTYGTSVGTDTTGNIFVAGFTIGGLDGNTLTGTDDFFVTKYDSAGTKQWTKQMGVATKGTMGNSVVTDTSGNIFVAGATGGGLDGNALTGTSDFFITKYNSAGTKQWTKQMGVATKYTYGQSVVADTSGNIFVAGYTSGGLDGNTLTGTNDFFVTKYNSAGTKQWTKQMGVATKDTNGYSAATDALGNVFVSGYTNGGIDGNTKKGSAYDFFLTKFGFGLNGR